jgi:hypothetical protein
MKFCPVVPEICRGQVHRPRKERKKERKRRIIIIIIITRYDYNLTIMKSPKPATDTIYGIKMGGKNSTLSDIIKI